MGGRRGPVGTISGQFQNTITTGYDMTTETATIHPTEPMPTTYRIRLHTSDVEGVRRLARSESHRLGRDIHWTVLVRRALRKMSDEQVTIG